MTVLPPAASGTETRRTPSAGITGEVVRRVSVRRLANELTPVSKVTALTSTIIATVLYV